MSWSYGRKAWRCSPCLARWRAATPLTRPTWIWRSDRVQDSPSGGFDHFGRLEDLRERLAALLGCDVDLVEEPAMHPRLREVIAREGVRAF